MNVCRPFTVLGKHVEVDVAARDLSNDAEKVQVEIFFALFPPLGEHKQRVARNNDDCHLQQS